MSRFSRMIRRLQRRKAAMEHLPENMAALESHLRLIHNQTELLAALCEKQRHWAQSELYNIKQTVNLTAAARPAGKKIKAVFLIHHIEAWDSLADIYEAMRREEDFEPVVISIKRRFPGETEYGFEEVIHQKLSGLEVPHLRFSMEDSFQGLDILKALAPDLIFRQSQWDNDIPPGFHVAELRFARLCYVPYFVGGPVETQLLGKERDPEVDSDFHRAAWKIFYATEDQKARFEKNAVRSVENVEIVGHPKVKRLTRIGAQAPYWPINQEGARRFRSIWSPHHSVGNDWLRFGLFPLVYKAMLEWVKNDDTIEMVLHFHPAALSALTKKGGALSSEECEAFLQEWDSLPNTARHSAGNYAGLMQASDCMITDGISFLAEYQFFTKPVIFLERADHLPFSPAGERIIKGTHPVASVAEARELARNFAAGCVDVKAPAQRDNTAWLAGEKLAAGTAAERILRSIRRSIREEGR